MRCPKKHKKSAPNCPMRSGRFVSRSCWCFWRGESPHTSLPHKQLLYLHRLWDYHHKLKNVVFLFEGTRPSRLRFLGKKQKWTNQKRYTSSRRWKPVKNSSEYFSVSSKFLSIYGNFILVTLPSHILCLYVSSQAACPEQQQRHQRVTDPGNCRNSWEHGGFYSETPDGYCWRHGGGSCST